MITVVFRLQMEESALQTANSTNFFVAAYRDDLFSTSLAESPRATTCETLARPCQPEYTTGTVPTTPKHHRLASLCMRPRHNHVVQAIAGRAAVSQPHTRGRFTCTCTLKAHSPHQRPSGCSQRSMGVSAFFLHQNFVCASQPIMAYGGLKTNRYCLMHCNSIFAHVGVDIN